VEVNRYDRIGIGEKLGSRGSHPPPEQGQALMAIPIFEAGHLQKRGFDG